jgi:hypothetical protein
MRVAEHFGSRRRDPPSQSQIGNEKLTIKIVSKQSLGTRFLKVHHSLCLHLFIFSATFGKNMDEFFVTSHHRSLL